MVEKNIKARLELLVDQWRAASPSEKILLVREKMRLEEMLEDLRSLDNAR